MKSLGCDNSRRSWAGRAGSVCTRESEVRVVLEGHPEELTARGWHLSCQSLQVRSLCGERHPPGVLERVTCYQWPVLLRVSLSSRFLSLLSFFWLLRKNEVQSRPAAMQAAEEVVGIRQTSRLLSRISWPLGDCASGGLARGDRSVVFFFQRRRSLKW